MRKSRKPEPRRSDIVTDVCALLDAAGVDNVIRATVEDLLHRGYSAQGLVSFADSMHRRLGCRIGFLELISEFPSGQEAA